jgi:cell division transport system ATP-binding protein
MTYTMSSENIVSLKDVSIFQKNTLVLSNVCLDIQKGEFVYLIGKTGTGKSSLLKSLYGELPLVDGNAVVAGYDLLNIKQNEIPFLRRKIGIVFQDFQLLTDRCVEDNLLFVMKATGWKDKVDMEARMNEVLHMVGLSTKGHKMPHQLSGGEQQRICIARALINHPALVLADEPTGNLDPDSSNGIMQLLLEISRSGSAVLMATHNYSLIEHYPGRIVRCVNGKFIEIEMKYTNEGGAHYNEKSSSYPDDLTNEGGSEYIGE